MTLNQMDKRITLRVQSPSGVKRIQVSPGESTTSMFDKVHREFSPSILEFALYIDRKCLKEIISGCNQTVKTYKLVHGDIIYLIPNNDGLSDTMQNNGESSEVNRLTEDHVDVFLKRQNGKIQRKRDERLCCHGANGSCVHCAPLEPYDDSYLKEQNIKHMSFHSYIRKLTGGVDRGKFVALEDISCQIRPGCKDHPPWPKGICSKCQPSAITLNQQVYRHVDNTMFENPNIVDRFLNYWRVTGHQRIGYLYGRYEVNTDVPLGIRAVVAAIYEPPQESGNDSIKLLPDEKEGVVTEMASVLGLKKIGWMFTDLFPEDMAKGTVKHLRNIQSYFLSAQECITAGHLQNENPNPCQLSQTGTFGSKFVTICVTGDMENQVHMEGYQVSNQCMALVKNNCLLPTKDAPELGYVKESSEKQYVPDVFYKEKDVYGNEVTRLARPLPVEYLLVDVPVSTPLQPRSTFTEHQVPFPIENRLLDGHIQDFEAVCAHFRQFRNPEQLLEAFSNFHLLLYLCTMELIPLKEFITPLLESVCDQDYEKALNWSKSGHWATVQQLMSANATAPVPALSQNNVLHAAATPWTCSHCTFINQPEMNNCEICNLPR